MVRHLVSSLANDSRGFRRAVVEPEYKTLGLFLETGLGNPSDDAFTGVRAAAVVADATGAESDYTSDAFFVEILGRETRIRGLYNDDLDLVIPTEDFIAALDVYADYWAAT